MSGSLKAAVSLTTRMAGLKRRSSGRASTPPIPLHRARTPIIKPRRGGDTYRDAWKAALAKRPDWTLIDGWNDFSAGANLAPSLEIGFAEDDQTKIQAHRLAGNAPRNVKFLYNDVPAVMRPGRAYNAHLRAQNSGLEAWSGADSVGAVPTVFAYRWKRGEQIVATGEKVNLPTLIPSGENADVALVIQTTANGSPLPAGAYILEIGAARDEKKGLDWFGTDGGLRIPVRVGETDSQWAATLIKNGFAA